MPGAGWGAVEGDLWPSLAGAQSTDGVADVTPRPRPKATQSITPVDRVPLPVVRAKGKPRVQTWVMAPACHPAMVFLQTITGHFWFGTFSADPCRKFLGDMLNLWPLSVAAVNLQVRFCAKFDGFRTAQGRPNS